tara:strand:+ start:768 stop:1031 length:264 start_codon:yes stop_codon:yes gene_type:complete
MATQKDLENKVSRLNSLFGFKGRIYNPRTRKTRGKEFFLGGEYGRVYLGYRSDKTQKKISDNLTKNEMEEFLKGYRKGLTTRKKDFK